MAFDQHIEADRIDDFNFISNFVRLPLLILGGVLGGSRNSKLDDDNDSIDEVDGAIGHLRLDDDIMDCSSSDRCITTTTPSNVNNDKSSSSSSNSRIVSDTEMDDGDDSTIGLKRGKKMSWSDESGQRLVQYNDEASPHEPVPSILSPPRSVKSAMKRSHPPFQSEGGPASAPAPGASDIMSKRYLPRMGGSSINVPPRPFGGPQHDPALLNNGAEMSPQYGFYINITPPTPEMYYSNSSNSNKAYRTDLRGAPTLSSHLEEDSSSSSGTLQGRPRQNHVFGQLQSSNAPMGWTSVPI